MKGKSIAKLTILLLIIVGMIYVAIAGVQIGNYSIKPASEGIKKGLDIAGGSVIVYEADTASITNEEANTIVAILRQRLTTQGYTEANVVRQGDKRFSIEIPDVTNPEEVVKLMGKTAKLSFVDKDGNEVLSGDGVKNATRMYGQLSQTSAAENYIQLELTPEGQASFSEATAKVAAYADGENYIAIKLDEDVISQPRVQEKIDSDTCIISGQFTVQSAQELADLIRAGQMPHSLKEVSLSTVGATLGADALNSAVLAGLISIIGVVILMVSFYRIPGLVASIALVLYAVLTIIIYALFGVNITLPGIAGIVLSFGMAVDANVVIFERIIDELKQGKTLRAAVDAGYHRALTAVIDSNVTTLIAVVVLWYFGSGTVQGFAITLGIGVVVSMFTAIIVTKFIMVQMISMNIKNRRLYGIGVK